MKKIFFVFLLVLSTHLTAYTSTTYSNLSSEPADLNSSANTTLVPEELNMRNISSNPSSNNLNLPETETIDSPFAPTTNNNSMFVSADFLYWKAREAGADNWAQEISSPGAEQSAEILGVPFNDDAGFRIGTGYQSNNNWDVAVYYTRYNTNASDTATGNVYSSYLGNFYVDNTNGADVGPTYGSGDIDWGINFNVIDLDLGHVFSLDRIMNLHPFIGLKLASIQQSIDTNWYNPINVTTFTSASENITNDFKGIGPSLGLDTSFILYKKSNYSFNIFGDFSAALLYANWNFSDKYNNNEPASVMIDDGSPTGAAPMLDGAIGLEWQGDFTKVDTRIRLGYEEQVWYDQLKFYSFNMGQMHDNLSLQGLTLGLNFNFK